MYLMVLCMCECRVDMSFYIASYLCFCDCRSWELVELS